MKCCECDKDAKYLRATQFSGDHYFCKDHAILEERFGEKDGYQVWFEIVKTFVPNKFSKPIIFKREVGGNFLKVSYEEGFCTFGELKEAMEQAEDSLSIKLHKAYNLIKTYSESEDNNEFDFNKEKFTDAVNLGKVSRADKLEIEYLVKEGFIELGEMSTSDKFEPIQKVIMHWPK